MKKNMNFKEYLSEETKYNTMDKVKKKLGNNPSEKKVISFIQKKLWS